MTYHPVLYGTGRTFAAKRLYIIAQGLKPWAVMYSGFAAKPTVPYLRGTTSVNEIPDEQEFAPTDEFQQR